MAKAIVSYQDWENYGAHSEPAGPDHWKPKFGDLVIFRNVRDIDHARKLAAILERDDESFRTEVTSLQFVEDGHPDAEESQYYEDWETKVIAWEDFGEGNENGLIVSRISPVEHFMPAGRVGAKSFHRTSAYDANGELVDGQWDYKIRMEDGTFLTEQEVMDLIADQEKAAAN